MTRHVQAATRNSKLGKVQIQTNTRDCQGATHSHTLTPRGPSLGLRLGRGCHVSNCQEVQAKMLHHLLQMGKEEALGPLGPLGAS